MRDCRILQLTGTDRWRLRPHMKSLDPEDRRLRFGVTLNDAAIDFYVDSIDFDSEAVLGVKDGQGDFRAVVHVAPVGEGAELGLSVRAEDRGQGLGGALFEQAAVWARNRFLRRIYMHCLRENRAILHIARAHGMTVSMDGSDSSALLELPAPDVGTWVGEQAMHWCQMTDDVMQLQADWMASVFSRSNARAMVVPSTRTSH